MEAGKVFGSEMAMFAREITAWSVLYGTLGLVWALLFYFIATA